MKKIIPAILLATFISLQTYCQEVVTKTETDSTSFQFFLSLYRNPGNEISNVLVHKYFQFPEYFAYSFTSDKIVMETNAFIALITQSPHMAGFDATFLNTFSKDGKKISQLEIGLFGGDISGLGLKEIIFYRNPAKFVLISVYVNDNEKLIYHIAENGEIRNEPKQESYKITRSGVILKTNKKGLSKKEMTEFVENLLKKHGYEKEGKSW